MECNALCEIFDRDDVGAVGLAGEQDARVHRLISQLAVDDFAQDHSAGAAVAFGASLLGADGVLVKTKVIEQRQYRRGDTEAHVLSTSQEPDFAPHARHLTSNVQMTQTRTGRNCVSSTSEIPYLLRQYPKSTPTWTDPRTRSRAARLIVVPRLTARI